MITQYKTVAYVFRLTSEGEMVPTEGTKKLKEECKGWLPILQSQSITPDGYHLIVVMTLIKQEEEVGVGTCHSHLLS